ncbi:MAG: hypothetical protein U0Q22_06985 [Acidimicrobiales bacterium]
MTWVGVGYCADVVLAVVFVVAAVAKVRDRPRVVREFDAMGIRWPHYAATVLAALELVVAALLVSTGWPGAAGAVAVLGGFTVVLVRQIRSGSQAPCACFGAASSQPVSWVDIVRNAVLMVAALVGLAGERAVPRAVDAAVVTVVTLAGVGALRALRRRAAPPRTA